MSAKPTADVSVRVAWGDDAPGIAAVQVRAWRAAYADVLPADALEALDAEQMAEVWRSSLVQPQDARNRVLVALERNRICGFAITGPPPTPTATRSPTARSRSSPSTRTSSARATAPGWCRPAPTPWWRTGSPAR